ncbi:hypothetical protein SDC9_195091 [bioreactor metagenome]|uniref:Uncharacterized protein n=1 Tax=bioreactor metagenome TaxID=1076179 RepID=A0A645IAL4_9ZZZZ
MAELLGIEVVQDVAGAGARLDRSHGVIERRQHPIAKKLDDTAAGTREMRSECLGTARHDMRRYHVTRRFEQTGAASQVGKHDGFTRLLHTPPRPFGLLPCQETAGLLDTVKKVT